MYKMATCGICYHKASDTFESKRCNHGWCMTCHIRMKNFYGKAFPCPFCRVPIKKHKKKRHKRRVELINYEFEHQHLLDSPYCDVTQNVKSWRQRRILKRSWRANLQRELRSKL